MITYLSDVYNKIKDDDRFSLGRHTLNNYLYINTNMPCLDEFEPTPAANYWIAQKRRRPKSSDKSRQQEWYRGVFPEASAKENRDRHPKIEF